MYQIGDKVLYGMHGVCVVVDLEKRLIDRNLVEYLVLEPAGQTGSRYLVPAYNEAAMKKVHRILAKEEMESLLSSVEVRSGPWIQDEGQRKQCYRELIHSGDRMRLLQMVCSLYRYRVKQAASGKKFHMCDENFLRDAEKIICSELAITMEMTTNEAKQYLQNKLKEDA